MEGAIVGVHNFPIWMQITNSLHIVKSVVSWLPNDGIDIKLKDDWIMANPPVKEFSKLIPNFNRLERMGSRTLVKTSRWNFDRKWKHCVHHLKLQEIFKDARRTYGQISYIGANLEDHQSYDGLGQERRHIL